MSIPDPEQERLAPPRVRGRRPLAERLRAPDSYGLLLLLILGLLLLSALVGELHLVTVVALLVGNIGRGRIRP